MKRRLALLVGLGAAALAPFIACSDDPGTATGRSSESDASLDGARSESDGGSALDAGPTFNTDGWLRVDFDPGCEFYTAPSPDKMPPPVEWEPCASTLSGLGLTCRQIKFTWPPANFIGDMAFYMPSAYVDATGKVLLVTGRFSGNSILKFVAEADGPIRQAIEHSVGACHLSGASINGGKSVFHADRSTPDEQKTLVVGAVGGDIDRPAVALESWSDGGSRSYRAGPSSYFAAGPEDAVRSYTRGAPALGMVTFTDPGQVGSASFVNESLFLQVGGISYSRIKVYSPTDGARDLIAFSNDTSAAFDLGTDGSDMAWIETSGPTGGSDPWSTIDVMTAKFTTDSSKIQKRRLRSEQGSVGAAAFAVGCGYAARFYASVNGSGVRVVRLSDGRSWRLSALLPDAGPYWYYSDPKAITCDELFVNVNDNGQPRVARIRLDSLGAGEAAD